MLTPLMLASSLGDIQTARLLILSGANLSLTDRTNLTALHYACVLMSLSLTFLIIFLILLFFTLLFFGIRFVAQEIFSCFAPIIYSMPQVGLDRYLCTRYTLASLAL